VNHQQHAAFNKQVDLKVAAVTGPYGRLQTDNAIAAVSDLIRRSQDPSLAEAVIRKAAQEYVQDCGERFSLRRHLVRGAGPYHPMLWLKLGRGEWVRMGYATAADLIRWSGLSFDNRTHVDKADDEVQMLTKLWVPHYTDDLTILHDVQRSRFGHLGAINEELDGTVADPDAGWSTSLQTPLPFGPASQDAAPAPQTLWTRSDY
jgi:hypothetical protein